jgi:hypothetical protein
VGKAVHDITGKAASVHRCIPRNRNIAAMSLFRPARVTGPAVTNPVTTAPTRLPNNQWCTCSHVCSFGLHFARPVWRDRSRQTVIGEEEKEIGSGPHDAMRRKLGRRDQRAIACWK